MLELSIENIDIEDIRTSSTLKVADEDSHPPHLLTARHAEIAAIRLYIARQVQISRLLAGSFYRILRMKLLP